MTNLRGSTTNINSDRTTRITREIFYIVLDPRSESDVSSGWITINIEGKIVGACHGIRVVFLERKNGRVYYLIDDEGYSEYNGKIASSRADAFDKYFSKEEPIVEEAVLTVNYIHRSLMDSSFKGRLDQAWADLIYDGKQVRITINTFNSSDSIGSIPAGRHKILRPDVSHAKISTEGYASTNRSLIYGNDVWFPIEINGVKTERFVHLGHISEGCVTVYEIEKWGAVYDYLIRRRLYTNKSKYVATLLVNTYSI